MRSSIEYHPDDMPILIANPLRKCSTMHFQFGNSYRLRPNQYALWESVIGIQQMQRDRESA